MSAVGCSCGRIRGPGSSFSGPRRTRPYPGKQGSPSLVSFLAVFREGAETVLFIHALAQSSGGWSAGLIAGLAVGAVILMVLFFAINVLTRRLPLRPRFIVTSGFLFLMALKCIGEAIQGFQGQQIVPYTEMRGTNWLSGVGLNPTLEAISTQLFVIGLAATTFLVLAWRMRHAPRSTRA